MPGGVPASVPAWTPGPRCGVVVRGAGIAGCLGARTLLERSADEIRLAVEIAGRSENLLLVAGDGSGVFMPVFSGFIATLRFDEGELVDVAYEPAFEAPRWQDFQRVAAHLRELRRLVAGAARDGIFHPQADTMAALARQIRYGPPQPHEVVLDPTLALHVAYVLHDQGRAEAIRDLDRSLSSELARDPPGEAAGGRLSSFFDLALLAGDLQGSSSPPSSDPLRQSLHPPFPMLARGWALLSAFGAGLPEGLAGIQRDLLPSLWTHFNPAGTSRLRELLLARRLR